MKNLTLAELKQHCKENGIKKYSSLNKEELIKYIAKHTKLTQKGGYNCLTENDRLLLKDKLSLLYIIYMYLRGTDSTKIKEIGYIFTKLLEYLYESITKCTNTTSDSYKDIIDFLYIISIKINFINLKKTLEYKYCTFLYTKLVGKTVCFSDIKPEPFFTLEIPLTPFQIKIFEDIAGVVMYGYMKEYFEGQYGNNYKKYNIMALPKELTNADITFIKEKKIFSDIYLDKFKTLQMLK